MTENAHTEVIKEVGLFGLKTLVILNAGGLLSLLTFVGGAVNSDQNKLSIDFDCIEYAMASFLVGLAMVLGSVTLTYILAQMNYSGLTVGWKSALLLMLIPAVLAFVAFCAGVAIAMRAIG